MSKKGLTGIAVAFLLPLSFYIVAKVTKKDHLVMPVYYQGSDTLSAHEGAKAARSGTLKPADDLQLVNQFGETVSLARDLKGRMIAINFFFTTCTSTCPDLTSNIRLLQYAFRRTPMRKNDTMVQFVSISLDPAADTPTALRAYAKSVKADENHWWFLTGDKAAIYNWARNSLHLTTGDMEGGADGWKHSNSIVVLDQDHFVRGYYDGLDTASVGRCANDLGLLAMERKRK